MRISDWSSDVCSSDLLGQALPLARIDHMDDIAMRHDQLTGVFDGKQPLLRWDKLDERFREGRLSRTRGATRSEEHTSELQSLMRISYAVFCLKKTKQQYQIIIITNYPPPQ